MKHRREVEGDKSKGAQGGVVGQSSSKKDSCSVCTNVWKVGRLEEQRDAAKKVAEKRREEAGTNARVTQAKGKAGGAAIEKGAKMELTFCIRVYDVIYDNFEKP